MDLSRDSHPHLNGVLSTACRMGKNVLLYDYCTVCMQDTHCRHTAPYRQQPSFSQTLFSAPSSPFLGRLAGGISVISARCDNGVRYRTRTFVQDNLLQVFGVVLAPCQVNLDSTE